MVTLQIQIQQVLVSVWDSAGLTSSQVMLTLSWAVRPHTAAIRWNHATKSQVSALRNSNSEDLPLMSITLFPLRFSTQATATWFYHESGL